MTQVPAIVLLSGGLDSTTILAMAKDQGYALHALTFRYGQRHDVEVSRAVEISKTFDVRQHVIAEIDLRAFGHSALTDDIPVPKHDNVNELSGSIPVTYVPARNTIFLSYALAFAESLAAGDIFIGVNAVDYSGYPDCRPEYMEAFTKMANLATRDGVTGKRYNIHTPLIGWSKAEIIRHGQSLGIDYGITTSCYDPDESGRACGHCDACLLRKKGFEEGEVPDPTTYQT